MVNNIIKSIWAIFVGTLIGIVLTVGTDKILESTGVFPPIAGGLFVWWMLFVALVYRGIFLCVSGFIIAKMAPNKPINHVVIAGIIAVIVTILGSIANWDNSVAWYPIALIIITLPCIWIGGKMGVMNSKRRKQ